MKLGTRSWELSVDTLKLTGHRIRFQVTKTLKKEPNTAEITIYNLSDDQAAQLMAAKAPLVRLHAGYDNSGPSGSPGLAQIFLGHALHVECVVEGANTLLTVTTGDGADEYKTARVHTNVGTGQIPIATVLRAIATAFRLKEGNVESVCKQLDASPLGRSMIHTSGVLSGSCADLLSDFCRAAGYEFSIQDGCLQILPINKALESFAVRLTPDTGLVGSPTISSKGVVSGTCLIQPNLDPGRQVEIDSRFVQGHYRLERVDYTGDTEGDDWYVNFEARSVAKILAETAAKGKK